MALLPYLLDCDLKPRSRLRDHLFALDFSDDLLSDVLERPRMLRKYMRPWRNVGISPRDVGSTIQCDNDKFQVNVDVQHFSPEEISVKTADGHVIIEGKHEEREDDHGFVSRQFKRRYALPEGCNDEMVESRLSSDGVLTVIAPRRSLGKGERVIPITHTGPVRRKPQDEKLEIEEEQKSPQKKRRR